MIIRKVAFGNTYEAYIENRLKDSVNIIFSDDNNKGKTLLIQGLMYALGNKPIFPNTFNYKENYFYCEIEHNNLTYEFLRRKDTIIVKTNDTIMIFDSVSDLKKYISNELFEVPKINKDGLFRMVNLEVFYEIFFIGQDKRNPSNVINKGLYNKQDFVNMLCTFNGHTVDVIDKISDEQKRDKIRFLQNEIRKIDRMQSTVEDNPELSSYINKSDNLDEFDKQSEVIANVRNAISTLQKEQRKEQNRLYKLRNLQSELRSISRNIQEGTIACFDCGSNRIVYSNDDFTFEVNNPTVRKEIMSSIEKQIKMKQDSIDEITSEIHIEQDKLREALSVIPPDVQSFFVFNEYLENKSQYDQRLFECKKELKDLQDGRNALHSSVKTTNDKRVKMEKAIVNLMDSYYRGIDRNGNLRFDKIFTKNDETYSGAEEQEYYYSRLLAFNNYFEHKFPIVVDSFRSGELSSNKENIMLNNYIRLGKQVILTATLKEQEYSADKYSDYEGVNRIDYSVNEDSHILRSTHASDFKSILESFKILSE